MAEPMGKDGVHTFYTLEGATAMRGALEKMTKGRLVVDVCDMPIKCPVAPIEFVFLADYYFTQKGIRDAIDITLVTPYSGAFTKPNANRVLTEMAKNKGSQRRRRLRGRIGGRGREDAQELRRAHDRL